MRLVAGFRGPDQRQGIGAGSRFTHIPEHYNWRLCWGNESLDSTVSPPLIPTEFSSRAMTIIHSTAGAAVGTPSSGAAMIIGTDGVATVGSRHASVSKQPVGADHTPGTEHTVELHTYVQHLEGKIDALTRTIENDRAVREDLADIRRLLNVSNSRSGGSGRDRRGSSPLREESDAGREAARSRRPARERLGPRASGRGERSANSHDRRSRSPRNDTRDAEK